MKRKEEEERRRGENKRREEEERRTFNHVNDCHWQIKLVGSVCKLDCTYINEKSPHFLAMSALLTSFLYLLLGSTDYPAISPYMPNFTAHSTFPVVCDSV